MRIVDMTEVIVNIPKNKIGKVASILREYGVEIMKIKDAYNKNAYLKLEPIKISDILGAIAIGGDALKDTEAIYD